MRRRRCLLEIHSAVVTAQHTHTHPVTTILSYIHLLDALVGAALGFSDLVFFQSMLDSSSLSAMG